MRVQNGYLYKLSETNTGAALQQKFIDKLSDDKASDDGL